MVKWTWSGQKPVNVSERGLEAVFDASRIYVAKKSISISRGVFSNCSKLLLFSPLLGDVTQFDCNIHATPQVAFSPSLCSIMLSRLQFEGLFGPTWRKIWAKLHLLGDVFPDMNPSSRPNLLFPCQHLHSNTATPNWCSHPALHTIFQLAWGAYS